LRNFGSFFKKIDNSSWPEKGEKMPDQIKILCVDDEKNVLKALRRTFMDNENYSIYTAESGAEGLEALSSVEGIHLVISDYRMPGMSGVEFLRQVNERWPNTVRIVLSGYADTAVVVEAVNLGHIYKFIPKPWDDNDLLINISAALEHQKLRQENTLLNVRLKEKNLQLEEKNKELHTLNYHLEDLVQQRTRDLEIRNHVLQLSQAILDVLPFAVFGIDAEDYIVHGNNFGCSLFSEVEFGPLGHRRQDVFSAPINSLIERVINSHNIQDDNVIIDGRSYRCQTRILDQNISRGIVLVLAPLFSTPTAENPVAGEH
jgi:FixJ family two-component response regulator